jgi:hypothetical protein
MLRRSAGSRVTPKQRAARLGLTPFRRARPRVTLDASSAPRVPPCDRHGFPYMKGPATHLGDMALGKTMPVPY